MNYEYQVRLVNPDQGYEHDRVSVVLSESQLKGLSFLEVGALVCQKAVEERPDFNIKYPDAMWRVIHPKKHPNYRES